jgi:hypothetical protein
MIICNRGVDRVALIVAIVFSISVAGSRQSHAACPVFNPECHRPGSPPPRPIPVPPNASSSAAGKFSINIYRSLLEGAGEQVLQAFRDSHREGALSWSGRPPTRCGHDCVDPPDPPSSFKAANTVGWLNFHWEGSFGPIPVSKDVSI